ncbi:MAG: hypothetical protein JSS83_04420 [Cyanobacteria bacterium SZAS LIN-3]|nr:hypothetical protein [Cyanobacteria bacterium SZAS LIN-3]
MLSRKYLAAALTLLAPLAFCGAAYAGEAGQAVQFVPLVASRQQSLQQVVNEVSRPSTGRVAVAHRRHSHWKTRYWNQHSVRKHK